MLGISFLLISLLFINKAASKYPSAVIRHPLNENSPEFCIGRPDGNYCDPGLPKNIIQCPDNTIKPCPQGRTCSSIGKVPSCYFCESAFDVDAFCLKNIGGLFCPEKESGMFRRMVECKNFKFVRFIECPEGSMCFNRNPLQAFCLAGDELYCRTRPKLTVASTSFQFIPTTTTFTSIKYETHEPTRTEYDVDIVFIPTVTTLFSPTVQVTETKTETLWPYQI